MGKLIIRLRKFYENSLLISIGVSMPQAKCFNFAKAFLKYLIKIHLDTRYQAFDVFLQKPKALKERKNLTTRIISTEDITNILLRLSKAEHEGLISHSKAQQYAAFVLFGAYTGQRTQRR